MKKLIKILICSTAFLLGISGVAHAALATTDPTVNVISAFRSVVEDDDQLYVATFEIFDTTGTSDTATVNYLFRLYDDEVEIATATPYAYYDDGYDQGIIGFYFAASDANLPTWETTNLSLELTGNPTLDWGGDPPSVINNAVDSWSTGGLWVGARVRTVAEQLEDVWTGVDLIERVQGVNRLTANGEDYFETTIPNLRVISPELFTSTTSTPYYPSANRSTAYGDTVEDRWLTSGNSTFDMTVVAGLFGTSRNWIISMIYVGFCIGLLFASSYKIASFRGGTASYTSSVGLRPALFLFGALMIVGSFMGFMVFEVGLFAGILGGLAIVFSLFWKGSV